MDLLKLAKELADRVEAEAAKVKIPVSVCVMDIHGNSVLLRRMNGAPAFSMELSERKAYTSALVGLRTIEILSMVQPGQPLFPLATVAGGKYCAMGGGVPVKSEGAVIAGIGVSGGTVEQDISIVEAALK
jgi:uncharacterized protein GlcG (DUF336 family)